MRKSVSRVSQKLPRPEELGSSGPLITIFNQQKDAKISASFMKKAVTAALAFHHVLCDEVAIHFVTNRRMCQMHGEFFDDPSPTDCMSFPYDQEQEGGYFFLGEIFVCPKQAQMHVDKHGGDLHNEILLYVVHGLLHLLGYDDMNVATRKVMRRQEKRLMKHLGLVL